MDMAANTASSASVSDKLDQVIADISALAQRQQIQDEIMLELVNFLAKFREDAIGVQHAHAQKLHEAVQVTSSNIRELSQSNASFANNLVESFKGLAVKSEHIASNFGQLRQVMHAGIRKMPPASGKIRCVFLVHMIEAWDAQIDIFHAMKNDGRFDPLVVSIDRVFPGDNACGGESSVSEALTELGIAHLRLGMPNSFEGLDILRALAPDVIFRQSQWDRDYPAAFRTEELGFARLCAITYGTSLVSKFSHSERDVAEISPMAFDQPYHRSAWRVFCETEQTQSYFRSFQHSDPSKFVLSGYPKHERLVSFIGKGSWPIHSGEEKAFRVIWAPHHSVGNDWLAFGVFHRIYRDMLAWAQRSPNIEFALKPHPALFALVVKMGLMTQADVDGFKARWNSLPNCLIIEGQYGDLFAASDLMLTDGVSFLTEYQLFNKPLVFIDSQRRVPFNALGELAHACAETVTTMEEIENAVLAYAGGKPWGNVEARERLLEKLLPNERPSTEIVLDSIASGIGV